jgi:hypothetical protein
VTATGPGAGRVAVALSAALTAGDAPPVAAGVTAEVRIGVLGGPGGDEQTVVRLVDGTVTAATPDDPADGEPDVAFTLPAADAAAVVDGSLSPSVAFMRGRLKTAGDEGLVLRLLAATAGPDFDRWLTARRAATA